MARLTVERYRTRLWFIGVSNGQQLARDYGALNLQLGLDSAMNKCNDQNIGVVNNNNAVHIHTLYNITLSPVYSDYCLSFRPISDMIRYWVNIIIVCIN